MDQQKPSFNPAVITKEKLRILVAFLMVLLGVATYIFGMQVIYLTLVSIAIAIVIEVAFSKIRKRPLDHGILVTPLMIALLMPPTAPLWLVLIASGFGVFFGKAIFGGLGRNIFNPAAVGYLFVIISFPAQMATQWLNPRTDAISSATPLINLNAGNASDFTIWELLLGNVPGTLGETFRLGIIVLGIALIVLKIADWRIPTFTILSVFVFTAIGHLAFPSTFAVEPLISLFVGGLMFGAFFVATDPVTAPLNKNGKIIYAVGIGLITVLIRNMAAFPEGIIFAVIIMNAVAPLIDHYLQKTDEKESFA